MFKFRGKSFQRQGNLILFDTNNVSIGDKIEYKLYSQLESNITALDPLTGYTTTRTSGVTFDTSGNYGSVMFKEFSN